MGTVIATGKISRLIRSIRGQRVILDADLAVIYGVKTRVLNQAVKRNHMRFPRDFFFMLKQEEILSTSQSLTSQPASEGIPLRSQIVISKSRRGGRRYRPCAFTEHGASMAATVLNSPQAVRMSLFIIRAFVKLREDQAANTAKNLEHC